MDTIQRKEKQHGFSKKLSDFRNALKNKGGSSIVNIDKNSTVRKFNKGRGRCED